MTLGERVAFLMKENNLKGEEFAKIFNKSSSNISSILNDKTKPSPELAIAICSHFGCTLDWFWTGKGQYDYNAYIEEIQSKIEPKDVYKDKYIELLERHNKLLEAKVETKDEKIREQQLHNEK